MYVLEEHHIPALVASARPVKRFFLAPKDGFVELLSANALAIPFDAGSGYIFATLLPFLQTQGVDLLGGAWRSIAENIQSERRGLLYFFLTPEHHSALTSSSLIREASADSMAAFYFDFNESDDANAGQEMALALEFLISAASRVTSGKLGLVAIN
ncbi:hypothetical protein N789_14805 [Arenimonas oryziterrae DSM 21050 = YC6267]|uniref:Uncharacterized protein n=2 Tax=Arenimonas TaxID=490567 RepID=A0A091AQX0_9GAMM|nr:hypothetical protein N789_14805 [Arenimonas oryziterrae DSM 21050 = YC6267]